MLPLNNVAADLFEQRTARLRTAVLGLVDSFPVDRTAPAAHSRAMADLAGQGDFADPAWGDEPITTAHAYTMRQLIMVLEGASATAVLLSSQRTFTTTLHVIQRSVAENAGRAQWLADPSIALRERFVRSRNERLAFLYEEKRLRPVDDRDRVRYQIRSFHEGARRLSLEVVKDERQSDRKWIQAVPPSSTDLIRSGLPGVLTATGSQVLRAFLSAAVHGNPLGFVPSHGPPQETALGTYRQAVRLTVEDAAAALTTVGWIAVETVGRWFQYAGWDAVEWSSARSEFVDASREHFPPRR